MIEELDGHRDEVLAIEATGEVSDEDYVNVLEPAIADRLTRHDKIRLLYVLGERFEGYDAAAMWEDAKLGTRDLAKFERVAVVTDTTWVRRSVQAFAWLIPGHLRVFDLDRLDDATTWIAADD